MRTVFLRVLEELNDKEVALRAVSVQPDTNTNRQRFDVDPATFSTVPGSPFAYWVSDKIRKLFRDLPPLESDGTVARRGVNSNDDERFLRLRWECYQANCVDHVKGGVWSPYYADVQMLLRWGNKGKELEAERVTARVYKSAIVPSRELYGRAGITWPRRTKSELSFRAMPAGCIFGDKGPAVIIDDDEVKGLLALLALGCSRALRSLVELQLAAADAKPGGAAHSFEVGVIQRIPVPKLGPADENGLATLAKRAWSLKRGLDTANETSHAFVLPTLVQVEAETLGARAAAWNARVRAAEAELVAIQSEIDERCFALYGIDVEDRRAITEGFGGAPSGSESSEEEAEEEDGENEDEAESGADATALASELVSWAVGVAFGRFDVRLATSDRPLPVEPEPFDPLPVCSPGMLTGNDGLPLARPPAGYQLSFPDDGILVDDPGHPRDLTAGVRTVFEVAFDSAAEAVWQDVAALLDPRDHDLRRWLTSGFFEHHLRRYSKSRRKAPILWQLGIPSGRYSVWCYAHRMTRDRLFAIQNDIVAPKLAHEERRLSSLITQAGQTPSVRERAEIAAQESVVDELRTLLEEVRRVAPLWNPDLDDGIVLVMAPLWRLVPTHRAWQKELKARWDELAAGKYDWAQLAMHLWPERVVPKCATDHSLAIAHELEDVFWAEGGDGKWTARTRPTRPIAELMAERTSPAVKAALVSLLDSPSPIGGGKRRNNSRQT